MRLCSLIELSVRFDFESRVWNLSVLLEFDESFSVLRPRVVHLFNFIALHTFS